MEVSRLEDQIGELRLSLEEHIQEELVRDTTMADKMLVLETKLDSLEKNITSLLNLWEQARGMLTLVKWCAAIAGFLISIAAYLKSKV